MTNCPYCRENFDIAGESSESDFLFVYCPLCLSEVALATGPSYMGRHEYFGRTMSRT